jgi:diaminopimelate decarboxylase
MTTVPELLTRFGSPLYVYRLDQISAALHDLRSMLPSPSTVLYSLKANPHPDLARQVRLGGCGAEVSSVGELRAAADAGFAAGDCFYTGPAKTRGEIATAVLAGVRRFSVESLADLRRVAGVCAGNGTTVDCLIRVNTGVSGPSGLRMSGMGSQFGVLPADLDDAGWIEQLPGARVVGAHFFPMSNAHDEDALLSEFLGSMRVAARLRDEAGLPMSVVDLGGGFAAPYAAPGSLPRYPRLQGTLEAGLDTYLPGWRDGSPEVVFESGRYLVAGCGSLVCTVTEVKRAGGKNIVLLDSGINHLGGMSGLGRFLRPAATPRPVTSAQHDEPLDRATVVGPLCTPADVLGADVVVGAVAEGEAVVVENVGAYGLTASLLAFLSRPAPTEVVVCGGNVVSGSRIAVRRAPVEADLPCWTVDREGHDEG